MWGAVPVYNVSRIERNVVGDMLPFYRNPRNDSHGVRRLRCSCCQILAHLAISYHRDVAETTRGPVMLLAALAFSLAMLLIADIDRPGQGLVNVSQQALTDVGDSMTELEP